jgi:PAS domain S-box-containing protein
MPAKPRWLCFRRWRPASIRSHLIAVVLATMIPLLIFAVAMIVRLGNEERATFQRGATERTRALLTAVDTELKSSVATLQALSTSPRLDRDDLGGFYENARRVLNTHSDWSTINLALPSGQQVMNLLTPFGSKLPMLIERHSFEKVLRTRKPALGNLVQGEVTQKTEFSIRVPIVRNGAVRYVLSAVVKPESLTDLLAPQRLPPNWVGAVLDGNRRFVIRTVNSERSIGQVASDSLRTALESNPEGWFRGVTIEGWDVYAPYSKSEFSGWTVALGIPAQAVDATFHRSLLYGISFGVVFLSLCIMLAWFLSGITAKSIRSLAVVAEDLRLNKTAGALSALTAAEDATSGIAEIENVRSALTTASRLLWQHSEERDRGEAALRQVSERLELAQDAANVGTFERDLVTDEIKWSPSQEKLYGLVPGSFDGRHESWAKQIHPDDITRVETAVRQTTETQAPLIIEFRIVRRDGHTRWMLSQARVLTDKSGVRRMLGVNIDITDRKEAEKALREANRRKDEFLAMLGHELRNPLGIISNAVQGLLRIGPPDPRLQELREMIERQIIHTSRILDELLDVSRISNGKIQLDKQRWDLCDVVRQTAEDHRDTLQDNGLTLQVNVPDKTVPVIGDQTRIAQALGNLLHNACKFTERGGKVTVTLTMADGENALVSVRDNGIGIEPDVFAWIFEPFSQADRTLDRTRGGLGLGLALVKGIVELHGGEVLASSDGAGRGAEFTMRLPVDTAQPAAVTPNLDETTLRRSWRILIVEDNHAGARSMRLVLELMGHTVEVAHDGFLAIEAARSFKPEVILCDIGLPGIDGYGVGQALRRDPGITRAYLIGISGYAQDERRAADAGFDAHVTKPVSFTQLETILAQFQASS